jgi:hypothetical protein
MEKDPKFLSIAISESYAAATFRDDEFIAETHQPTVPAPVIFRGGSHLDFLSSHRSCGPQI